MRERVIEALAADHWADIDQRRAEAVHDAALGALFRAQELSANGDRELREAYDELVVRAGEEVLAAARDLERAGERRRSAAKALRAVSAEVGL